MLKPATYNIADSNIAMLGSDLEKKVKAAAANKEPAWEQAGKKVGLIIWRIEKFQVKAWPEKDYGDFYSGDSYIVLRTYKKPGGDALLHDVHFWLGAHTTQDEAGTAAYKTVELDDKLGGAPVQYREVQGSESQAFLGLFPKGIKIMAGGIETGFRHVKPTEYKPRLLHVRGTKNSVTAMEVPYAAASFNNEDCFIVDNGMKIFQWSGSKAGVAEKNKAAQLARAIDDERGSKVEIVVAAEGQDNELPWAALGGKPKSFPAAVNAPVQPAIKKLLRVSDAKGGVISTTEVANGKIKKAQLDTNDVFIVDLGPEVFVWVGKKASKQEKSKALQVAADYLKTAKKPLTTPIARVLEGGENEVFAALLE